MCITVAWQKLKRDIEQNRDPVYDSDGEDDWTPEELRESVRELEALFSLSTCSNEIPCRTGPRLSGFLFRNHTTNSKDVLRYQGNGPACEPEELFHYMTTLNHADGLPHQSPMSPDAQYRPHEQARSSSPPSGISPSLTHATIKPHAPADHHEAGSEGQSMALDSPSNA